MNARTPNSALWNSPDFWNADRLEALIDLAYEAGVHGLRPADSREIPTIIMDAAAHFIPTFEAKVAADADAVEDYIEDHRAFAESRFGNAEQATASAPTPCVTTHPAIIVPTCPDCGGTDIGHVERALVAYKATGFCLDEKTGELDVINFEPDFSNETIYVDWDTTDSVDYPWTCMACRNELYWDSELRQLMTSTNED